MAIPGFWAAIRLTAFANCEVFEANWRTLWPQTRKKFESRPARHPRETAARPGFVPEDLRAAIRSSIFMARPLSERAPQEWDVLAAHKDIATLKAMRLLAADVLVRQLMQNGPIEESPRREWPRRARSGRNLTYPELCAIHRTTRERLGLLCAGTWRPLIRVLSRRRFGSVRLVFFRHSQLGTVPAAVPAPETRLDLHIDRLFLETLVAGLWCRFYRCEGCGYFGVRERSGQRARRLCPRSKCRVAQHRMKRKAEEETLRSKVVAALRGCTEPDRTEFVRKQFGLSPRQMNRLLRNALTTAEDTRRAAPA